MIAFLKGTLAGKTTTTAYIEVSGVGYAVGMSQASLSKLPEAGSAVEVHTYLTTGFRCSDSSPLRRRRCSSA